MFYITKEVEEVKIQDCPLRVGDKLVLEVNNGIFWEGKYFDVIFNKDDVLLIAGGEGSENIGTSYLKFCDDGAYHLYNEFGDLKVRGIYIDIDIEVETLPVNYKDGVYSYKGKVTSTVEEKVSLAQGDELLGVIKEIDEDEEESVYVAITVSDVSRTQAVLNCHTDEQFFLIIDKQFSKTGEAVDSEGFKVKIELPNVSWKSPYEIDIDEYTMGNTRPTWDELMSLYRTGEL